MSVELVREAQKTDKDSVVAPDALHQEHNHYNNGSSHSESAEDGSNREPLCIQV